MTDEEKIISLLNGGSVEKALEYISTIADKSPECQALEDAINDFIETYGAYLGKWIEDRDDDPDEFTVCCRYEDGLILCLQLGETIEGERKLFDLMLDGDYDTFVFHSERFDPDTYHHLKYNFYWETVSYHWETDSGLSTIGSDYIKQ